MFEHKKSFFEDNDAALEAEKKVAELYVQQPARESCKNCAQKLGASAFVKLGVPYTICTRCGQVNGLHEDTTAFCQAIYTHDGGESYGATYSADDAAAYAKRVADIYLPKAAFVKDVLVARGHDPATLRYADIGAGAGYFAAGLVDAELPHVTAYEVSPTLVALSQAMRPDVDMRLMGLDDVVQLAESVDADVVSLVGVLEHVQHPRDVVAALRANPRVQYLFLLVPVFSPSVFIELAFPHVVSRLLAVEHTHLYTESSLVYLAKEFGMRSVGEWWFGADMIDLYRSLTITIEQEPANREAGALLAQMFVPMIDGLQGVIDTNKQCSEVHLLLEFDRT